MQFQEELEEQQRQEQQSKKKLHRLYAELSDAKIHLEETTAKNFELEKKQRKCDHVTAYSCAALCCELRDVFFIHDIVTL